MCKIKSLSSPLQLDSYDQTITIDTLDDKLVLDLSNITISKPIFHSNIIHSNSNSTNTCSSRTSDTNSNDSLSSDEEHSDDDTENQEIEMIYAYSEFIIEPPYFTQSLWENNFGFIVYNYPQVGKVIESESTNMLIYN